jgi:nicotinate-nucleotide adenylyltransferase
MAALFDYAHICVAARLDIATAGLPPAVAQAFSSRLGTPEQIRNTPHGLTYLAQDFAVDISATRYVRHYNGGGKLAYPAASARLY